jgi:hypothetical protein
MQLLKCEENCRLNGISGQINILIDKREKRRKINTIYLTGRGDNSMLAVWLCKRNK